ncbi:MAG: hypothetical protein WCQ32_02655 [bacterium]
MNIQYIRNHTLSTILICLIFIISIISFYKFFIKGDYVVAYNGTCDPQYNKCFTVCSDDQCTTKTYFSKIQKYKPDLYKECGNDITNCDAANSCITGDRKCSITYCSDSAIDIANNETCSDFTSLIKSDS